MKKSTPKREKITFANYQKEAMKTCLPSCRDNKLYLDFGIRSEVYELLAKLEGYIAKVFRGDFDGKPEKIKEVHAKIRDEIGDVAWFLALYCEQTGKSFEKLAKAAPADKFEDFVMSYEYSNIGAMSDCFFFSFMAAIKRICKEVNIKLSDTLRANIAKLASRKERGKIQGDGDER